MSLSAYNLCDPSAGASYLVHLLSLPRAVYIWVGAPSGAAPAFGSLCASVPPLATSPRGDAAPATCLLGDAAAFEDCAARLSARLGKLVLMSSALGGGVAAAAAAAGGGGGAAGGGGAGGEGGKADAAMAFASGDTAWLEAQLFEMLRGSRA